MLSKFHGPGGEGGAIRGGAIRGTAIWGTVTSRDGRARPYRPRTTRDA